MFRVTVRDHVMIAHSLPDPFFGPAQRLHGATYVVEATFLRADLDHHAVVVDIGAATEALRAALADLAYRNLDEHPSFPDGLSTTEAVARLIGERLAATPLAAGLDAVDIVIREHPDAWVGYHRDLRA